MAAVRAFDLFWQQEATISVVFLPLSSQPKNGPSDHHNDAHDCKEITDPFELRVNDVPSMNLNHKKI